MPHSARRSLLGCLLNSILLWLSCVPVSFAQECLSLSSSKACPAFHQYSIDLEDMRQQYPMLMANVTDIHSFDEHLLSADIAREFLITQLGCTTRSLSTSTSEQQPQQKLTVYGRYILTRQCAILTQSKVCNENITLPRLCQTTCNTWVESVTSENAFSGLCSSSSGSSTLTRLVDECANTTAFNGTAADGCISGSDNEPDACGFQWDVNGACQYCYNGSNGKDYSCCTSTLSACGDRGDRDHLSSGAIVGIVFGSLVFGALLCSLFFYFGFLRKKKKRESSRSRIGSIGSSGGKAEDDDRTPRGLDKDRNSASQQTLVACGSAADGNEKTKEERPSQSEAFQTQELARTITAASLLSGNLYTTIHAYPPQQEDELTLYPGEILMVVLQFDDGWGFGYNLSTGEKGAFPMVCVAPFTSAIDSRDNRSMLDSQQFVVTPAAHNNKIMEDSSVVLTDSPIDKDHSAIHILNQRYALHEPSL